ncbi:MAG: hypothetical protein IJD92_01990 [Bacilli bacterium]|nr:hypothetical protein [Bacilli bacterium]
MRTENNGKLAIAIVAMLVVALSIVGVTYAYFTAQVSGNTATTSGQISAGILSINYSGSQTINVQNVVPDWETSGEHYYDPVASRYNTDDGVVGIKAVTKTQCTDGTYGNCSITNPTNVNGIADEVEFTVTNTHENGRTAYYAIKLTGISNPTTASTTDEDKIVYTLSDGTNTYTGDLAASGEQVIVPAQIAIKNQHNDGTVTEADYTDTWTLNLKYPNIEDDQSAAAGNKALNVTVKVVGISQGTDGWYEEYSETPIVFATNN